MTLICLAGWACGLGCSAAAETSFYGLTAIPTTFPWAQLTFLVLRDSHCWLGVTLFLLSWLRQMSWQRVFFLPSIHASVHCNLASTHQMLRSFSAKGHSDFLVRSDGHLLIVTMTSWYCSSHCQGSFDPFLLLKSTLFLHRETPHCLGFLLSGCSSSLSLASLHSLTRHYILELCPVLLKPLFFLNNSIYGLGTPYP